MQSHRVGTVCVVILVVAVLGSRTVRAQSERPNILFCIADDASYPHMGAYGCEWVKTPGFDRVAREGLLFHNAYTPNAKCAPSRACIVTGRNSWQLGPACNHWCEFPVEFPSYPEVLEKSGYFVGKTGKGWGPGVAKDATGQTRNLVGKSFDGRKLTPPARGISGNDYAANFSDFLEAAPEGQPWCFWFGGYEPHRGYEYRSGVRKGEKRLSDVDKVPGFLPDNEVVRHDMLDYAYEIEWFDSHVVKMLDELERREQLDNTLVVVTADNGMPFPRVKGQVYEMSNHLPLAIMWRRGINKPGRRIDDYVSFIDFAPTFLSVAGVDGRSSGFEDHPGQSLVPLFQSEVSGRVNPLRDHVLLGKERHDVGRPHDWGYPVRGIVKDGMLYLRNYEPDRWPAGNPETGYLNTDGSPTKTEVLRSRSAEGTSPHWELCFGKRPEEELYDVRNDPECLENLAEDPAYSAVKNTLHVQMLAELKTQGDLRTQGRGQEYEAFRYADPGTQGFYERFMKGEKVRAGWVNPTDFDPLPPME